MNVVVGGPESQETSCLTLFENDTRNGPQSGGCRRDCPVVLEPQDYVEAQWGDAGAALCRSAGTRRMLRGLTSRKRSARLGRR